MRVKFVDLLEVASDDVVTWFEACETRAERRQLALDMKKIIDSVAAIQEKSIAERDPGDNGTSGVPPVPGFSCQNDMVHQCV